MCARLLCTKTGIEVEKNFLVRMKFVKCSLEAFQGFVRMARILSKIKKIQESATCTNSSQRYRGGCQQTPKELLTYVFVLRSRNLGETRNSTFESAHTVSRRKSLKSCIQFGITNKLSQPTNQVLDNTLI